MEHRSPSVIHNFVLICYSLPFLHLLCNGSCVSQGGTASYKKKFKNLYSLIQKYNEKHKNLVE